MFWLIAALLVSVVVFVAFILLAWTYIDDWEEREERKADALERLADRLDGEE